MQRATDEDAQRDLVTLGSAILRPIPLRIHAKSAPEGARPDRNPRGDTRASLSARVQGLGPHFRRDPSQTWLSGDMKN
jgi:hypothetical protein